MFKMTEAGTSCNGFHLNERGCREIDSDFADIGQEQALDSIGLKRSEGEVVQS